MILDYQIVYKRLGIRKLFQLFNPISFTEDQFVLPKSATLHYIPVASPDLTLPESNDPIFHNFSKKINMIIVDQLTHLNGGVRPTNKLAKALYREWALRNNSRFKITLTNVPESNDPMQLNVYVYSLLDQLYKYSPLPISEYYQWFNLHQTLGYHLNQSAKNTKRHQFFYIDLPTILPSIALLKTFSNKTNPQLLKVFNTSERLYVLEFWKFLDADTRVHSIFNDIEADQYPLINIIFRYQNRCALLNLGLLESWSSESTRPDPNVQLLKPEQLQRFFLKFLFTLQTQSQTNADILIDEEAPIEALPEAMSNIQNLDEDRMDEAIQNAYQSDQDLTVLITKADQELSTLDTLNTDLYEEDETDASPVIDLKSNPEEKAALQTSLQEQPQLEAYLKQQIDQLSENSVLSAAEYRQLMKYVEESQNLKSPYDPKQTLNEFSQVKPEEIALTEEEISIPDQATVLDKGMLKSTLLQMDKKYVRHVLKKDVIACVNSLKNAGIIIKDYQIEEENSAMGRYEIHTLKVKPIRGADSTMHFRIPKISDEGEMVISGNKYRMRRQRGDNPIRKINPSSVALSSYYGKVFVNRCERKQFDELDWLNNQIMEIGLSGGNDTIKKIAPANVFNNKLHTPLIYSSLSKRFKYITTSSYEFVFDYNERLQWFDPTLVKKLEQGLKDSVICGRTKRQEPVLVDDNQQFFLYRNNQYEPLGTIFDLLMIDQQAAPVIFSELKVFSKAIPLGIVMGYYMGLSKLIKLMGVEPLVIPVNKRYTLNKSEWMLRFKDYKLVFKREDRAATLILAGFNFFKDSLKLYNFSMFDHRDVYLNVLDQRDIGSRYLKEIDLLNQLFIDPITEGILKEMKEPTTFKGLLIRSNELLLTDWHPDTSDMQYMRIKGYERVAGMVYRELMMSVREFNSRSIQNKSQISINPYNIWNAITQDQTVKLSEDINPINDLKEMEAVTYVGSDGRAKEAMTHSSREYHPNDMGVISESTVDSGDVAINTFLSGNPNFKNLRGITGIYDPSQGGTSLLSTSSLLNPCSINDDPKRVNFLGIQNSHTVACEGYRQPQVRTGYEYIVPYRVGKMYACMAQEDGKVVEVTEKGILVEYKSGERSGVSLGNQIGKAEGSFYVHPIVTPLKANESFKKGDVIAYNQNFFEPDMLNPKRIVMKNSLMGKTVLMETTQTLEDSCSISTRLSSRLKTKITKEKTFIVNFNQNIRNILPAGSQVSYKDILFIIEDEITSGSDIFDEETIETLSKLSNLAPKAKLNGVIDHYEVFYNGDLEDMSPSLRKFVTQCDKALYERTRLSDHPIKTGQVNDEYRVEGKSLQLDTLAIKVYLITEDNAGVGDKLTSIQLKSIVSEVFDYPMRTESGEEIDYIFGFRSISARIVLSPLIIGTTSSLLKVVAKKAVELYNS